MSQSQSTSGQGPAYQLEVSRIFSAPPSVVRRAFVDASLRAQWAPTDDRPLPDPSESVEGLLTWAEQAAAFGAAERDPDTVRAVRVLLQDEPGGKTRMELCATPYTMAEEVDARAWWDSAFSALDSVLERLAS